MSLEIQWKPSWKHGRARKPCFQLGFHWISKLIHLTRIRCSGWVRAAWVWEVSIAFILHLVSTWRTLRLKVIMYPNTLHFFISYCVITVNFPSTLRQRNLKKAALFPRLDLTCTLIRHEKRVFRKPSYETEGIWKCLICVLVWTENILKKRWCNHATSLREFSSNPKWQAIFLFVLNFLGVLWKENTWCICRVRTPF